MDVEALKAGLYALIMESPVLLVYLLGLVISVYKKEELGGNSLLAIIAFSIALVVSVARVLFNSLMPFITNSGTYDIPTAVIVIGGMNLIFSILMAVALGIVVYIILFRSLPKPKE